MTAEKLPPQDDLSVRAAAIHQEIKRLRTLDRESSEYWRMVLIREMDRTAGLRERIEDLLSQVELLKTELKKREAAK